MLCHISEALNFPAPNICRDKIPPEIFRFVPSGRLYSQQKTEPDKLIVIYVADERKGVEYAKLFTEKGFDNIYLLSGGFEGFAEKFPNLLEGKKAMVYQAKAPPKLSTGSPKKEEGKGMTKTVTKGDMAKARVTGKITDVDKSSKGKSGEHIKPIITAKITESNPPSNGHKPDINI
eukprot:TRINITY_DN71879_c0_g1_i1.p1 TRINITY_DN71879_c0_g1~~TRINITY_DN71879_c0_g1_i1.p1  ORF type:complete len:176 (+),score=19.68 TRINITY_DN71879_c0_g1_i1:650-1177(+)